MSLKITGEEFNLLRNYIRKECGITLEDGKEYLVESRFGKLVAETGSGTFGEFYVKVVNSPKEKYRDKIIDAITTNETSWYRDKTPFVIFEEVILPQLFEKFRAGQIAKARIWSVACSTGQEPYSLAMLIREHCEKHPGLVTPSNFEIMCTDISSSALFIAQSGRYDQVSVSRGLPENLKNKYFTQKGRVWLLSDEVKRMITLKKFNLQNSFTGFGSFDVVLCRNVAIYFSEEFKKDLFFRLSKTMKPDSFFFLGSSESISGYSDKFEMKKYGTGVCYRLKK